MLVRPPVSRRYRRHQGRWPGISGSSAAQRAFVPGYQRYRTGPAPVRAWAGSCGSRPRRYGAGKPGADARDDLSAAGGHLRYRPASRNRPARKPVSPAASRNSASVISILRFGDLKREMRLDEQQVEGGDGPSALAMPTQKPKVAAQTSTIIRNSRIETFSGNWLCRLRAGSSRSAAAWPRPECPTGAARSSSGVRQRWQAGGLSSFHAAIWREAAGVVHGLYDFFTRHPPIIPVDSLCCLAAC